MTDLCADHNPIRTASSHSRHPLRGESRIGRLLQWLQRPSDADSDDGCDPFLDPRIREMSARELADLPLSAGYDRPAARACCE